MSSEQLLITLWRRKWIVVLTVIVATTVTYLVSRELPKAYSAQATLFVGDRGRANSDFEAIQSAQVLARTYAELIQSRNVARLVAAQLPGDQSADAVLGKMTFRPISDTQLIVVSAEGETTAEALTLARTYATTFTRYAADGLESATNGRVSIADQPHASNAPIRPRPKLYAGVMFVLSIFLGAGLALLRDRLDTRLGTEDELSQELALPALARVPAMSRRRLSRSRERFAEQRFLEAFRVLRTNLAFLYPQNGLTRLAVASAAPGEGKSTCAMALAQVVAEQGRHVVVIEGDMRRPALGDMYNLDGGDPKGLLHYLALAVDFDDIVHDTPFPNVQIVPAGAVSFNPSTLLKEGALVRLVGEASDRADFVIVDSPPLSAGADASILAHAVGDALLVVNQRRSSRAKVVAAVRQLRQADVSIAGFVLNEVPSSESYERYYDRRPSADVPLPTIPSSAARRNE